MYDTPSAKITQNPNMNNGLGYPALKLPGKSWPSRYPTSNAVTPTITPGYTQ